MDQLYFFLFVYVLFMFCKYTDPKSTVLVYLFILSVVVKIYSQHFRRTKNIVCRFISTLLSVSNIRLHLSKKNAQIYHEKCTRLIAEITNRNVDRFSSYIFSLDNILDFISYDFLRSLWNSIFFLYFVFECSTYKHKYTTYLWSRTTRKQNIKKTD